MSELKWYFRHNYHWPKTRQEAKRSTYLEEEKMVRAKRNAANLANDRDGHYIKRPRCWKDRRKNQYRDEPRGQRHELICDIGIYEWDFKEYCESHNIPYEVETINESYPYRRPLYEYRFVNERRRVYNYETRTYEWKKCWGNSWVFTGEYKDEIHSRTIGYRLIWWADKDIGIDYILSRSRNL